MKELVVFRCKSCSSKLKYCNQYAFETGEQVPMNKVEVVVVPQKHCECCANKRENRMMPFKLDTTDEKPWKVVFWEDDYVRDDGISSFLGSYSSFIEAYSETIKGAHINDWASCEVQLEADEQIYAVYCYATTEPYADEFVIN